MALVAFKFGGHPGSQLLLGFLDGELPDREHQQVRIHLGSCTHCRLEMENLRANLDLFANAQPSIDAGGEGVDRIIDRISQLARSERQATPEALAEIETSLGALASDAINDAQNVLDRSRPALVALLGRDAAVALETRILMSQGEA